MSSTAPAQVPIPALDDPTNSPMGVIRTLAFLIRRRGWLTFKYLFSTEVHTFAFSVAANAILSFFPAIVLLLALTREVFNSQTMYDVVLQIVRDSLPSNQEFVIRNLMVMVDQHRHGVQVLSIVMLFIAGTGIFLPLEVALNKIWNCHGNRSYLGNQITGIGLAIACGLLAIISVALTAGNQILLNKYVGVVSWSVAGWVGWGVMKFFAIIASIAIFFLIYWKLPNGNIRPRAVLPVAIFMGLVWELAKHIYIRLLPVLNFREAYGPFSISVTLLFWGFVSGLLLLGGAYLAADESLDLRSDSLD